MKNLKSAALTREKTMPGMPTLLFTLFITLSMQFFFATELIAHNDPRELSITGWDVYADPDHPDKTIGYKSFEEKHDVIIKFTPLQNLDAILNDAESDHGSDLFIISNEGIRLLHDMGLVQPLVLNRLPHYQNLHHNLRYTQWGQFDRQVYAAPWAWGPTGLLYDSTVIQSPDSWGILWNPEYQGKISLWNDVSMIWTTALYLGYKNVYSLTRTQLEHVKQKLFELNSQVYGYYDGITDEYDYLLNRNVIALNSWFDPSTRLLEEGRKFKMAIPKEGAVGMFDSFLIGKQCHDTEICHDFINHQLSPEVQQQMARITGLAPANIETLALLNPDEIKALHLDEPDYFNKMLLWDHMPRKHLYEQVLQEVREDLNQKKQRSIKQP